MKKTLLVTILLHSTIVASEFLLQDINRENKKSYAVIPYMFNAESTGLTAGAIGIMHGYIQPQTTSYLTVFMGEKQEVQTLGNSHSNEAQAKGISLGVSGYRPSFSKRIFLSFLGVYAYYPNQKLYINGENDSVKNTDTNNPFNTVPIQTQGYNNWIDLKFRYVLPWGEGKNTPLPIIKTDRGIPVNRSAHGGGVPFISGQTIFGVDSFYTRWTTDKLEETKQYNTNGLRVYLQHNNTDYPDNPSRGYSFEAKVSGDFGLGNSTQSWNALEAEYSHYIELNNFSWTRQNVLAFNLWSAYSPSWDKSKLKDPSNPKAVLENHRTPMWEGARLGGWNRMRAYDSNRFNDKAALYSAVEYRMIPDYNPLKNENWIPVSIDWFQTVFFAELGRVAPNYDLGTLTNDMKYDVGFSLRALAASVPVRFDIAYGEEGSSMWVMLKQPF